MRIETKYFGDIEIDEENIIRFPQGVLGFPGQERFVLILNPEDNVPFHWLQSIENGELCFIIVEPFFFVPEYDFEIDETAVNILSSDQAEELIVYSVAAVPEKFEETTINLLGPIVINTIKKVGAQLVLENSDWSVKHPILKQ